MGFNFRLQPILASAPVILLMLAFGSHVPATQNPATPLCNSRKHSRCAGRRVPDSQHCPGASTS